MEEARAEWVRGVALVLVVGYGLGRWALEALNRRHLHAGAGRIPERLQEVWDEAARERMVRYQSAVSRFAQWRILHVTGVMVVLAPRFILPLFNRFTPLPEGTLKERLLELARRTSFAIGRILVMNGSQRSRHANAYFTGFGRARRVVLYDTLTGELAEPEIESVVAHEIGHAKLGHIPKMILVSGLGLLVGFLGVHALSRAEWFLAAFGFQGTASAMTLLLCLLLSGPVLFWVEPLLNGWSRSREFEADAYAARWGQGGGPLIEALIKLNESNLSQWMPHPLYRWFYYSHPTLAERIAALERGAATT